ncbi:MAG: hypothetical protein AAGJ87_14755, partial [Pseudomonadota bacterium]
RGEMLIGRSTMSATISRSSPQKGTQVNSISFVYDDDTLDIESNLMLPGFRTRVVDRFEDYMVAYRVIAVRQSNKTDLLNANLDEAEIIERLKAYCQNRAPKSSQEMEMSTLLHIPTPKNIGKKAYTEKSTSNIFHLGALNVPDMDA